MAVLSDKNLSSFKKYVDALSAEIKSMQTYLTTAENTITSSTGATFRTAYAKGKVATNNIIIIIDTLQDLKNDLNTLVTDANKFYQVSLDASKKK